ncbi:hypothetical protein [Streptodolium elevatio]
MAGRIWTGDRVEEFALDDATRVAAYEDRVLRLAALGNGRLAAVLPARRGASDCRIAVGRPGAWEREVVLDNLHERHGVVAGLAMSDDEPLSRTLDGDPTLTVTEHGIVVADGRSGVVAHFTPDLDLVGLWYAGGTDETELIGYATAHGVLTTARWAARDSLIFRLTADGPQQLLAQYAAYAMPADNDRIWVVGNFDILLLDRDGATIATARTPRDLVLAAHAAGACCVMATTSSVAVAVAEDDRIVTHTILVEDLIDIVAVFPVKPHDNAALLEITSKHSLSYGYSAHPATNGEHHVVVDKVKPGAEEEVTAALREAGATAVQSRAHDVDGLRRPCCENS